MAQCAVMTEPKQGQMPNTNPNPKYIFTTASCLRNGRANATAGSANIFFWCICQCFLACVIVAQLCRNVQLQY